MCKVLRQCLEQRKYTETVSQYYYLLLNVTAVSITSQVKVLSGTYHQIFKSIQDLLILQTERGHDGMGGWKNNIITAISFCLKKKTNYIRI